MPAKGHANRLIINDFRKMYRFCTVKVEKMCTKACYTYTKPVH